MVIENKKVKGAVAGVAVFVLVGTGAAFAVAQSGTSTAATPASTTEAPAGMPTEVLGEQIEAIAPETVTPTTLAPTSQPAASSEQVKAWQEKLIANGYWMPSADGKVGALTQQAVMAFQKVNGLKRSGVFDDATRVALEKISRPSANASGDLIEIDKSRQVIFVVRGGAVQYVFNTSTGTEKKYRTNGRVGVADTPTGSFSVGYVVDGVDEGPLGDLYRPRYFTNNGIAVHGSASIPAYPASHGCARVSNGAMDFIWKNNLMPRGSSVWVYETPGSPAYSAPQAPPVATTVPPAPPAPVSPTTDAPAPVLSETTTTTAPAPTVPDTVISTPGSFKVRP